MEVDQAERDPVRGQFEIAPASKEAASGDVAHLVIQMAPVTVRGQSPQAKRDELTRHLLGHGKTSLVVV